MDRVRVIVASAAAGEIEVSSALFDLSSGRVVFSPKPPTPSPVCRGVSTSLLR